VKKSREVLIEMDAVKTKEQETPRAARRSSSSGSWTQVKFKGPTYNNDSWGTHTSAYSNAVVNYNGGILSLCSNEEGKMAFAQRPLGHPPALH
jgi:hypothetical protein